MLANIGNAALVITFLLCIYGSAAAIYGVRRNAPAWVDSSRNAMLLTFPLLTVSVLSIVYLLVTNQFQVEYVASVTSRSMPNYLRATALWGGQEGSLVFWSWLLAAFASAVTLRNWKRDREFLPWVVVVCLITLGFFLLLIIFFENPFLRLWLLPNGQVLPSLLQPAGAQLFFPQDGSGLNPLLRHPGMIIHPPLLYLGFVSFVIPFAFAIAALITGRNDDRWIRLTRRWTLWAWMFLSAGLVLGARWAYDVLGWGGYWGWDPVEIAAFMPWLTATPFLHSVMIQEKLGMFKHWNMLLIILTYDLVIFGTFLTRSGVLSSVHAFAQSAIGPLFFAFIGITLFISLALLSYRWKDLKSDTQLHSLLSRESFFLVNNLLFISILVICFLGVMFPLLSEVVTGQKVTVGPEWYERTTGPVWAGLLLLMGIAPLSAWRASTARTLGRAVWKPFIVSILALIGIISTGITHAGALLAFWLSAFVIAVTVYEFWRGASARRRHSGAPFLVALGRLIGRDRRRYGGYVIHLAVVLMAVGIIGIEIFQTETQGTIPLGGQLALGDYTITFDKLDEFNTADGRNVARAEVSVYKDGQFLQTVAPRRDYFFESRQPMTIPGLRSTLEDDLYILLVGWEPISAESATFKIYHNPLVNWVWIGSLVLILGTFIASWPSRERQAIEAPMPAAYASAEV
jgi:cytochrome c-type biogenesis protein CcmF